MALPTDSPIQIGTFSTASGRVIVVDGSYADLWRTEGGRDDRVDLRLSGPDAYEAGIALDLGSHPLYLFDVGTEQVDDQLALFAEFTEDEGFDATLEALDEQVAHPARINAHFESGEPTHGVEFDGVWAGAVEGLPPGTELPVFGTPFADETEFAGRWRDVSIVVSEAEIASSELRGYAAVDSGNLLFIDPIDLDAWTEGTGAGESTSYLSANGAIERDPHEATEVPFGDTRAVFFANRWGDGLFEVWGDYDAEGGLVRVRAEVGSERTRNRYLTVVQGFGNEGPNLALVSRRVLEGEPPRFVYRAEPDHERDSGWRILEGSESEDYLDDPENVGVTRVRDLTSNYPGLQDVMQHEPGAVFERDTADDEWVRVEDWDKS